MNKNLTIKQMVKVLRNAGLGITRVTKKTTPLLDGTTRNYFEIRFENGFIGTYRENDHVKRAIRSTKLDKRNKQAKEIIDAATEYSVKTLVRF